MSDFVHLHLHTHYSFLDGAIKLDGLIARAKELNQKALAITDHGNMHGAMEFYSLASKSGIKPIIGCEVYITSGSRHERGANAQANGQSNGNGNGAVYTPPAQTHHLTLLAENIQGYRNLCKLVTLGYTEGFYFKPRIDFQALEEHNAGLICLSGCISSQLASFSAAQNLEGARAFAERYAAVFGDRYYLEIQPHAIKEQQTHNALVRELSRTLGISMVATNDCHYLAPDDHHAQEVLMCISTGKLITDPDRIRHEHARLHFKTADEMLAELPEYQEAIRMTSVIADRCSVDFDFSTYYMPKYEAEADLSVEDLFRQKAREGLQARFTQFDTTGFVLTDEEKAGYAERLEEEIVLILKMGFAGYFLVVSDFILWAKHHDIPVGPGRGSAAGSLVAFALSITEIDPIRYKLLFERFLNPDRISLPDIDVDFCIFGRDRVIEYVSQKYGRDKVAQIVTFGTLKAKAAIKDVGRALGLSYAETDRIAKLIPAPRQGFDYPIAEALKMEKRLRDYADTEGKELIGLAQKLEGLARHSSTHAAGLVIADRPVVEFMPLMLDKDEQVVTQYSMSWVEKIGLVKFDFLGLKTLSVLHEAVRLVEEAIGRKLDLNTIPLDDQRTYKLVSNGRTIGVFQLESSGITDMVGRLKPNCFEDLVAILALYRPGPLDAGMVDHYINRKHGREPVRYSHPILEPILKNTYGIILYQEQIMQIARDLAGYSLAEADMLRRAMGKKKPQEMAKQREFFLSGATKAGVSEKVATDVFDQMETFARYGFNRSHSVAYALISYQTAYLKAHYPHQFLAALMTFEMVDTDRTLKNLNECRELGIEVLPPDVNRGAVGFNVVSNKILYGLAAIKGVGEKAVERILEERQSDGQFTSLFDFCRRMDSAVVNRRTLENFVKSGAFDSMGVSRAELSERLDEIMRAALSSREKINSPQMGLFGGQQNEEADFFRKPVAETPEWPINIKLAREKEALGFYLSGHPLEKFRIEFSRLGSLSIEDIKGMSDGNQVSVAGVVTFLKLKNTKKGDRYATFILEDLLETIEVIVWPDVYQKVQEVLSGEDPVLVTAKVDISDERRQLIAVTVESAIALRDKKACEALIRLQASKCTPEKLALLKKLLNDHRGNCPVKLVVRRPSHSETVIMLPQDITVAPSEILCNKVEQLFGEPVLSFR